MRLMLSIAMLIALAAPAAAKVSVSERTRYYDVNGRTGAALMASIRKRGTRGAGARHAIATTAVEISVEARPVVKGGRCRFADTRVRLKLTYRLPRWRDAGRASPRLRSAWQRFERQIRRHEAKHGAIAKSYARDLERAYKRVSLPARGGCRGAERQLRRIERLSRAYERRQQAFDRRESRASSRVRRLERALGRAR